MPSLRRTHTCGELRESHVGQTVTLNGWVNTIRAYPQQVFIDLRDRYGLTQVVVEADDKETFAKLKDVALDPPIFPQGYPFRVKDRRGTEYLYFTAPYPAVGYPAPYPGIVGPVPSAPLVGASGQ